MPRQHEPFYSVVTDSAYWTGEDPSLGDTAYIGQRGQWAYIGRHWEFPTFEDAAAYLDAGGERWLRQGVEPYVVRVITMGQNISWVRCTAQCPLGGEAEWRAYLASRSARAS